MTETWRPVPGHPGYEVSDLGRLKALAHTQTRKHPKTGLTCDFRYGERMLRPILTQYGYQQVNLDGKIVFLHRVVLWAFVGPTPEGMQACHGNGNRADNRLENLRWDTAKENGADRVRHGTQASGMAVGTAKYSDEAVAQIRTMTPTEAKRQFGISQVHYYRIKNGEARK